MCCSTPCSVARCNGCPKVDWNSFTWAVSSPASGTVFNFGTIERRFDAVENAVMRYPGTCPCIWVNFVGEVARDIGGTYNPDNVWYPIASVGVLAYERNGYESRWVYRINRYTWNWTYFDEWFGDGYGIGWNWSTSGPLNLACESGGGLTAPYANGWAWGWGYGYGYGFDPLYWNVPDGGSALYLLDGEFDCRGTNHFVRDDSSYQVDEAYLADSWPATIDVTRIARTAVTS